MGLSRTGPPALFTSESAVEARLDRSEWQRVYEECFPRVFRALVAAGARPDEAEDALHDAFEKALTRQDEIVRPVGQLRSDRMMYDQCHVRHFVSPQRAQLHFEKGEIRVRPAID